MVMSSSLAGQVMTTFFAPASRCFCASSPVLKIAPGQVRRIAVGKHGHVLAIHHQAVIRHFDIEIADAVDGVVLQQVSSGGFVAQIVDGDHLDLGIVGHGAEDEASDATESVDAYLGCHAYLLSQDTREARC